MLFICSPDAYGFPDYSYFIYLNINFKKVLARERKIFDKLYVRLEADKLYNFNSHRIYTVHLFLARLCQKSFMLGVIKKHGNRT